MRRCIVCGEAGRLRIDPVTMSFMQVCSPCLSAMHERDVQHNIDWGDARQARRIVLKASKRIRKQNADRQEMAT